MKTITMKNRIKICMAVFVLTFNLSMAQNFTQNFYSFPPGSTNNTIDFLDVDGDGDLDLFLTGQDDAAPYLAELYLNDGTGTFTSFATLTGVRLSGVAIGDVDGDGDLDMVVLGRADGFTPLENTTLYINDGAGNFTESSSHTMMPLRSGAADMADIDGDGDLDIIITGWDGNGRTIELHENDGSGNFTLVSNTPFTAVTNAAVRFADIDGDSDVDLFIMGDIGGSDEISELYLNDGNGNFSLQSDNFIDTKIGDAAFADVDNDGDVDLLIVGINDGDSIGAVTELYMNDGSGNFTVNTSAGFDIKFETGSIDFGDVDLDGNVDVLLTGKDLNGSGVAETKIYINNGSGNFTELADTPFIGVRSGDGKLADIDGDGDLDVIYSGWDENGRILEIFNSDASLSIEETTMINFEIYPNPSTEIVNVKASLAIDKIEVYNLQGKSVLSIEGSNEINIASLSNGIYLFKITSGNTTLVKKVVKN